MRVPCPQCGGQVELLEAAGFPACPYCGAGLVLDLGGVRPHFLYLPRVATDRLRPLVRRWAAREGYPRPGLLESARLVYHPFWRFAHRGRLRLVPAWPTLEAHWSDLSPPDAEQIFFAPERVAGADVVEPSVPEAAARRQAPDEAADRGGDLVHLPVFLVTVRLGDASVPLAVDACAGRVIAGWPALAAGARPDGNECARRLGLGGAAMLVQAAVLPAVLALPALAITGVWVYRRLLGAGSGRPT